jgi:hypothetical protein
VVLDKCPRAQGPGLVGVILCYVIWPEVCKRDISDFADDVFGPLTITFQGSGANPGRDIIVEPVDQKLADRIAGRIYI